jgi:DNA-binding phage protein
MRDAFDVIAVLREEVEHIGYSEVARLGGIDRTFLYRALRDRTDGCPNFVTVARIAEAVGMRLTVHRL